MTLTPMSLERILARSARIAAQISAHPLTQGLSNGTLPQETFKELLKQDGPYLRRYSQALNIVSSRLNVNDRRRAQLYKWFSKEITDSEHNLHTRYLRDIASPVFFSKPPRMIPVIANYTSYQWYMANNAPIEEAVACLTPCYWIYEQMGSKMSVVNQDKNPYQRWIASYSGEQFTMATQLMLQTLDDLSRPVTCPISQEKIVRAFYHSARYELMFYNAIYPTTSPQSPINPIELNHFVSKNRGLR